MKIGKFKTIVGVDATIVKCWSQGTNKWLFGGSVPSNQDNTLLMCIWDINGICLNWDGINIAL